MAGKASSGGGGSPNCKRQAGLCPIAIIDSIGVKLPLLSAFLGHHDAAATQVYLTMTPECLTLIGDRFEEAFGRKETPNGEE